MEEWVDCIRHKLSEMGILNPKGNLYTKMTPTKTRNPMSPLPQPPSEDNVVAAENLTNVARSRTSIVDVSDQNNQNNQSFTTSIYLNQEPAPSSTAAKSATTASSAPAVPPPARTTSTVETVTVTPAVTTSTVATSVSTVTSASNGPGATSSVYLNKSNPTRHVTVIPINKAAKVRIFFRIFSTVISKNISAIVFSSSPI